MEILLLIILIIIGVIISVFLIYSLVLRVKGLQKRNSKEIDSKNMIANETEDAKQNLEKTIEVSFGVKVFDHILAGILGGLGIIGVILIYFNSAHGLKIWVPVMTIPLGVSLIQQHKIAYRIISIIVIFSIIFLYRWLINM